MSVTAWILSACLAVGLLATAEAGTNGWTEEGPDVASISGVEFAANGNSVVFARGGDKFWKSTDAGQTWTVLLRNNTDDYPFALDKSDPNIMLVAGPTRSLLRSADGGANFSVVIPFVAASALAFGPGGVAYVSSTLSPQVRRSTNSGLTWSAVSQANLPPTGAPGQIPVPYDIAVDQTDSNRVYLAYRHPNYAGIYRSTDGGANWQSSSGLQGISVSRIAIDPVTTQRLFVATTVGVYVSNDWGATWAKVPDPTGTGVASVQLSSIAIDASQPQSIYAGGTQEGELFHSADGGTTWSRRDTGVFAKTVSSIAPRPGVSGEVLAGTTHTMYRTTNGGTSWSPSATGMKGASVLAIDVGSRLRVGYFDGGIYESIDGTTWTPLNNAGLRARVPTRRFSPVVEIREAARLFVSLQQDGVFASTDNGATWLAQPTSYNPSNRYVWGGFITELGAGPVHYAGTSNGVFKTTDNGDTWADASFGLTTPTITALAKNTNGTQLFAGTFNGMFRSTDGGANWVAINNGLTLPLYIRSLAYDTSGSNALLVGTNNGLFVTRDAGASYTRLTDLPIPNSQPSIEDILVEDFVRGSLYVGSYGRIFRSVDSGQTWTELSTGNQVSTFRTINRLVGDGPGVLYAGASYTGLHQYTVSPEMELIAQAPTAGTFPVGTQFPWHAQVRNNGSTAATFARFTWQLGANTSVISPTASRGQCSVASQVLMCDFGIMQPGDIADVDMTVQGVSGGPIRIQAAASSAEIDLDASNNTFADSGVRILEQVDLSAALSASASTLNSGETFDYILTIRNDGTTIATGAEFETNFDARDLYSLAAGSSDGCAGAAAGVLRCPLPAIAAGQSITYRWNVTAVPGGARTASAVVSINAANSAESDTTDNSASAALSVTPANDLSVQLVRSAAAVTRDNELNYVMTVTNNGLVPSDGVRARLVLGSLVNYVSSSGATCSAAAAVVTCDIATLAPQASGTVTVTVRAVTAGVVSAAAEVSGSNLDPRTNNNSASTDVTINDPPSPTPVPPPPSSGGSGGGGGTIDYLMVLLGLTLVMARSKFFRAVRSKSLVISRRADAVRAA